MAKVKVVLDWGDEVECRDFTNTNSSGIEVTSLSTGERLGSLLGLSVEDFESDFDSSVRELENWVIENQ